MKKLKLLSILLIACVAFSCKKDKSSNTTIVEPPIDKIIEAENNRFQAIIPSATVSASISGIIKNEFGVPLSNVKITHGSSSIFTNSNGEFDFGNLTLNQLYTTIKAEKDGFFDGFRTFAPVKNKPNYVQIMLLANGLPKTFDPKIDNNITLDTVIDIKFYKNSIMNKDRSLYTGTVSVYGRYISPNDPDLYSLMPGQLTGLDNLNKLNSLVSQGMINVELRDAQGNELQIATGQKATISIPAPEGYPDNIPIWTFNEKYGLWIETGVSTKINQKYTGDVFHFTPLNIDIPIPICGQVTDIDGNVYNTVTIGSQCWMAENLKTTRYNDGTAIPTGLSDAAWEATTSGAYAIYDNNANNNTIYGKLYNWYAVNTGKLAPAGWHVPTDAEWTTLINFLGGETVAGNKMKATTLWRAYTGITNTNSSGFTGLPAGFRNTSGTFNNIGDDGHFWSSTEYSINYAWYRYLSYSSSNAGRANYNRRGISVRCVRD